MWHWTKMGLKYIFIRFYTSMRYSYVLLNTSTVWIEIPFKLDSSLSIALKEKNITTLPPSWPRNHFSKNHYCMLIVHHLRAAQNLIVLGSHNQCMMKNTVLTLGSHRQWKKNIASPCKLLITQNAYANATVFWST